jgi:hypothetical protein
MLTREEREQKKARIEALNARIAPIQNELDEIKKEMEDYSRKYPGKSPWKELKFWDDRDRHGASNGLLPRTSPVRLVSIQQGGSTDPRSPVEKKKGS